MTEYSSSQPPVQQEFLDLIEQAEVTILNLRSLVEAFNRIGLDGAAQELSHNAESLVGRVYFARLKTGVL